MSNSEPMRFLRCEEARRITGDSLAVFYDKQSKGLLPRPVKIGTRAVAWPAHELDRIQRARLAGRTDDEIRKLVAALMQERRLADSPNDSEALAGGAA